MKKLIIATALMAGTAVSGFSQGQVFFQNAGTSQLYFNSSASSANKVTIGSIASQPAAASTSTGVVDVGLYWSATAFTDAAQGTLADTVTINTTTAGDIAGPGTFAISGAPSGTGTDFFVQVYAWDSTYATPDAAIAAGAYFAAWSAGAANATYGLSGAAQEIFNATVSPAAGIPIFGTGAGQWGRAVMLVQQGPEPTTLALGGLGAAALLMFRRRK